MRVRWVVGVIAVIAAGCVNEPAADPTVVVTERVVITESADEGTTAATARGGSRDTMDAYHEVLNDIRDELPDLDIDEDSLVNAPSFATVEAARREALDEAAEALNRRYLDGLDACEAEADATCFDDVLAVYDEHMDWLVQYAGGDWQPSTRY